MHIVFLTLLHLIIRKRLGNNIIWGARDKILSIKKIEKKKIMSSPFLTYIFLEILISSTSKISCHWINDLGYKSRLHQKLIGILVWWKRAIINDQTS